MADALLDGSSRAILKLRDEIVHVGIRIGNIAGLQGQQHLDRLAPQFRLDGSNVVKQLNRLVVADVVEPAKVLYCWPGRAVHRSSPGSGEQAGPARG